MAASGTVMTYLFVFLGHNLGKYSYFVASSLSSLIVAAVLSVVQDNVSHVDVGDRMTDSKNMRGIYVH